MSPVIFVSTESFFFVATAQPENCDPPKKMKPTAKVYPRYMALNSGQEAFQLFYERLLGLKERQENALKVGDSFYRNHQSHLATIVHTFNRHYCTEIGSNNQFYQLSGEITPVFLNLGLYNDPEYDLHRLLGIRLDCSSTSPWDHTFHLYFDHAAIAFDDDNNVEERSARIDKSMQKYLLQISIEDFTRNHYNEQIYQYTPKDKPSLNLTYDGETRNFSYNNYFDGAKDDNVTIDTPITMPPLFGRLFSTGVSNGVMQCTDTRRVYALLGTSRVSKPSYWTVKPKYVAWNRYEDPPEVKDEFLQATAIEDTFYMRIITLLFGCNSMLYVNENFDILTYNLESPVTYGLADYDKINNRLSELLDTVFGKSIKRTLGPLVGPGFYDKENTDTGVYIKLYHRYNNYLNCIDTTLETVKRLYGEKSALTPTSQKTALMKGIDNKLVTVDAKEQLMTWTIEKSLLESTIRDLERYTTEYGRYLDQMTKVLANFNKDMTKSF